MTRMAKDEWIANRTNNPDRLGKDVWDDAYKQFRNKDLHGIEPKISLQTEIEMLKDFLEKNGCEAEGTDNITRDAMLYILKNVNQDFEKREVSPDNIQNLYAQIKSLKQNLPQHSMQNLSVNLDRD